MVVITKVQISTGETKIHHIVHKMYSEGRTLYFSILLCHYEDSIRVGILLKMYFKQKRFEAGKNSVNVPKTPKVQCDSIVQQQNISCCCNKPIFQGSTLEPPFFACFSHLPPVYLRYESASFVLLYSWHPCISCV